MVDKMRWDKTRGCSTTIPREQGDDEGGQPTENPGQGLDQGRSVWLAGATMAALVVILFIYLGLQVLNWHHNTATHEDDCPDFNHDQDNCQDDNHEANSDAYLDMD